MPDIAEAKHPIDRLALAESTPLLEATRGPRTGSRMRIKLIDKGWGSSGYYSEAVLRKAAADYIYPAGTQMFLDHPTASESADRPERSVRDLAAVLVAPASFEQGALYGEARVFGPYQQLLTDMAEHIGVSIRASGYAEQGEAEGREGVIITGLTEGVSVDFVTKAGRGGQIVEVLESARTQSIAEAHGMTANDLAAALSGAVRAAHGGDGVYAWTCDYTDDWVVYHVDTDTSSTLLQQAYTVQGATVTLTGEPVEVTAHTTYLPPGQIPPVPDPVSDYSEALAWARSQVGVPYVPQPPAPAPEAETTPPAPPAQPLEENRMSGSTQPGTPPSGAPTDVSEAAQVRTELAETKQKLAEAELKAAQLGENATKLAEAEAKLTEAQREILRLKANDAARAKAVETLKESTLPQVAHAKVIAAVTGTNVPLGDEGALDEAALVKDIKTAIDEQRAYLTAFAEEAGVGQVRGLGGGTEPQINVESELGNVFQALGMSEAAAGVAAKGRG